MQQPLPTGVPTLTAPRFYITGRQPLRPGAILLATVAAVAALSSVLYALGHTEHAHLTSGSSGAARSAGTTTGTASAADEKDDPSQIDTIVLGDPADAPVPARPGNHVSPVHATILVRLPRFGDQVGLIPDTPAGRLLYGWLAAFNQASYPALGNALPNVALTSAAAAQIELRRQTGGFICSLQKRSSPASWSSDSATKPLRLSSPSVPSSCVRTPARRHRELQTPRRPPTPPGRHHGDCHTLSSLTAMSRQSTASPTLPPRARVHTRPWVSLVSFD
jgi:hypothetical protein